MRVLPRVGRLAGLDRLESVSLPASSIIAVYIVLLMLIPAQLIVKQIGAPGTPANGVAIMLLLWWVCHTLGGLNPVHGWTPTRICAGLLTLAVLTSYVNGMMWGWFAPLGVRQASDELWTLVPPSVDHVRDKMISAADRGLLSFAGWLGILLVCADGIRSWVDLERVVTWLVRAGVVVSVIGLIQFFSGFNVASLISIPGLSPNADFGVADTRSVLNRVSSTGTHAIEFGVVTAALMPLAIHRTIHRWGRPLALMPTVLIGVACSMSVSRSGILVLGAGLIVLMSGWPKAWRWRAVLLAPVCVVALRVAVPGLVGTIVSLFRHLLVDSSVAGRTSDYDVVLGVAAEHPWLGRGLFTFLPRYYRILDNEILMLLLELGAVGMLIALSCYVVAFFAARRASRDAPTPRNRHLGLALSASISGLALSLVTYDAWSYPIATGLTFLIMGLAGAAWRLTNITDDRTPYSTTTTTSTTRSDHVE